MMAVGVVQYGIGFEGTDTFVGEEDKGHYYALDWWNLGSSLRQWSKDLTAKGAASFDY